MSVLAGHAGIELRDDLLPAGAFERGVAEVGRWREIAGAVEPDVRCGIIGCAHAQQKRTGDCRLLARAEVGLGFRAGARRDRHG